MTLQSLPQQHAPQDPPTKTCLATLAWHSNMTHHPRLPQVRSGAPPPTASPPPVLLHQRQQLPEAAGALAAGGLGGVEARPPLEPAGLPVHPTPSPQSFPHSNLLGRVATSPRTTAKIRGGVLCDRMVRDDAGAGGAVGSDAGAGDAGRHGPAPRAAGPAQRPRPPGSRLALCAKQRGPASQ